MVSGPGGHFRHSVCPSLIRMGEDFSKPWAIPTEGETPEAADLRKKLKDNAERMKPPYDEAKKGTAGRGRKRAGGGESRKSRAFSLNLPAQPGALNQFTRPDAILTRAAGLHPNDATIQFNLACYEAQSGNLPKAKTYLKRATEIDAKFKLMALDDTDVQPLWGLTCHG